MLYYSKCTVATHTLTVVLVEADKEQLVLLVVAKGDARHDLAQSFPSGSLYFRLSVSAAEL